jgi:transposase InsO family protein
MKYEFIKDNRSSFRVKKMCQALKVSVSGYYAYTRRSKSNRQIANDKLLSEIRVVYKQRRGIYGSPRITDDLRDNGHRCGKNRVARLMKENKIVAKTKRRFKVTTQSKHTHPIAPNLVNMDFSSDGPNQLWVSDITYLWTREGWSYLATVMDVYSRQIVGWDIGKRLTQDLVINALQRAVWRRRNTDGLIFHSDRGSQYASKSFRKMLNKHKMIQSMSGSGNCYDNAIMESFFHTLKTEHVYFEKYETRDEAKKSIFEYIEIFYNRVRKHSALNYKSPATYEELALAA